jgi:hypothetical protein
MRAVPVVIVEEEREASGALIGVGIGVSVGPFAERGLDEALGLAVGLWSVRSGEAVFEAESEDRGAHGMGAVTGAVVRIEALGLDAVFCEESQGGVEEGDGALRGFIGEELGESQTGMIIDGDVEELPAGAGDMIALAVAGDTMAGADDAGELLDVEVDEFPWMSTFIATNGWRRFQRTQARRVPAQAAGDGRLGELGQAGNLEGREFAPP